MRDALGGLQEMGVVVFGRLAALILAVPLLVSCSRGGVDSVDKVVNVGSHSLHAVVAVSYTHLTLPTN